MLRIAAVLHNETWVQDTAAPTHAFLIGLPAFAVGRVGQHEVELVRREAIVSQGGPIVNVVGRRALALQDQVGLADGVGLRVHLLAVEVNGRTLAALAGQVLHCLLGNGEHPAGAAGAVVEHVGGGFHLVGDGPEDELRHQLHHVPGGEVLAGLLVVVLAEAPDQLLKDRAHAVVVQTLQAHGLVGVERRSWAEVHRRVKELLDEEAQGAGFDQGLDLVAEPELFQHLLDVG